MTTIRTDDPRDTPKMLQETLSLAIAALGQLPPGLGGPHVERLARLQADLERQRPTGPDGKHGNRHTPECGCEDR